jgi:hypothetical protein
VTFLGGSGNASLSGGGFLDIAGGDGALVVVAGGGLHVVAGAGPATLALSTRGADITFGANATTVTEASWGAADMFHFVAGHGGGTDVIQGFRPGTDQLLFEGVGVTARQVLDGDTWLTLNDGTQVELVDVATPGLAADAWWHPA